ncbi:MAG: methylated-DNA--[protein]-cysteine S-methyltransferase [Oscillospiraceae bacterium]
MYYKTTLRSPVGVLTLASDGENLCGLWMEGQKYYGQSISQPMAEKDDLPVFSAAKNWLQQYFAKERPSLSALSLSPMGSKFRQLVWQILYQIPYGQVITYGDIAKQVALQMGLPSMSGQAVGGAVGHNSISIIIPCHRVVGSNGSLTGYAGGIDTKIKLLQLEGANISSFHVPKTGTAL